MKDLKLYKFLYGIRFVYTNDGTSHDFMDHDLFETEEIAKEHAPEIWAKLKSPGDCLQCYQTVFFGYFK